MPEQLHSDQVWMDRALALANASAGLASPNPQVGCVLVRDGQLIGEGAHLYADRDHAEIVALKQARAAGFDPRGATAYVTLEPCSHHGRTGPCADALIAAGIARCVVATADPNPLVSGQGLAKLRAADVEVVLGPGQAKARELNDAFAFSIQYQRPFVTLKAALSADGHLAPSAADRVPNQPFWLTGEDARAEVQRLRHRADAVLTGIGTVLADNPALTDRSGLPRRRPLLRVIVDSRLRIPLDCTLVRTARARVGSGAETDLWVFTSPDAPDAALDALRASGVRVSVVARTAGGVGVDLHEVLRELHRAQILSGLVEGGSALNGALLDADLVDEVILFHAERVLGPGSLSFAGGHDPFSLAAKLLRVQKQSFGPDLCLRGLLHDPWAGLK